MIMWIPLCGEEILSLNYIIKIKQFVGSVQTLLSMYGYIFDV